MTPANKKNFHNPYFIPKDENLLQALKCTEYYYTTKNHQLQLIQNFH